MSAEEEECKQSDYWQLIKGWFKKEFERDLDDDVLKDFPYSDAFLVPTSATVLLGFIVPLPLEYNIIGASMIVFRRSG